ncbi:MAG: hypothetical protein V4773_01645 [Verrucomicrobiota bacterium]
MRRLIHLTFALFLGLAVLSPAVRAAEGVAVQALLITASNGKGGSDPRLAEYEANLKRSLRFDTFKLVGQGSANVAGNATIGLPGGHRLQLSGGERAGNGLKVRVEWTQGGRELMNTQLTLQPGIPAILGRGGEGEAPVVLLIAR